MYSMDLLIADTLMKYSGKSTGVINDHKAALFYVCHSTLGPEQ